MKSTKMWITVTCTSSFKSRKKADKQSLIGNKIKIYLKPLKTCNVPIPIVEC